VGVFSSRQLALACERHLACLAIVGPERPDFRTLSAFRKQPLEACKDVFGHVVRLAGAAGLVKLGTVSTDGTQLQGHASRHKAMSDGYMQKAVERLREEIAALVPQADQQDEAEEAALGRRRGDALPAELARRDPRWARIAAAMRRWEAEAKAAAEAARTRRAAAAAERGRTGQKRRGKVPTPIEETPDAKAQMSLTAPARQLMRRPNKGWEDCGNAHASVDGACQIIVACAVTDATHDTQQAAPLAQAPLAPLAQAGIEQPKDEAGDVQLIPATLDNGDDSETAVQALEDWGVDPYLAPGRQKHHEPEAEASDAPTTAKERMAAKVRTPEGKAVYARRKVIVEPVCGQIKAGRGFRRFLLRGLKNIRGAWRLVGLTHNLLKLWRYGRGLNTG
jgi:DDE family transposase